jgi:aryl-alcohol dehydrogenase-like predicted oxidoreductase
MNRPSALPLVRFGRTELFVTRLCQGTAFRHLPRTDDPRALEVLHRCLDLGINFFDSATAYGWGGAEKALGKAIAGRRSDLVICTKVVPSYPPEREGESGQPAHFTHPFLCEQLENSLRRLGTDYVDLYLLHQPDTETPVADIAEAMHRLVEAGKVRYWGVSNHSAAHVSAFVDLEVEGTAIAGVEDYYNIAGTHLDTDGRSRVRVFEEEMFPILRREDLGCLAFSPMDTGHLAPGNPVEGDEPLADLIETLDRVAGQLGVPRAAVCVAWVLTRPEITSVLAGSESSDQVEANLLGAGLELDPDLLSELDAASASFKTRREAE